MKKEDLIKFNRFRELCLINSEDAIKTAESLLNKNVHHISLHLAVFGLEEIGKVFVGWYQFNSKDGWDKECHKVPIDDHIKKLFWAIWGPSFANEKITKAQIDEIQNMASQLHNMRLDVMYTELTDTMPSSNKIPKEEVEGYVKMARSRLELAKLEGEVDTHISVDKQEEMKWFMDATNDPGKRNYIFGNQSQEKLIDFGNVKDWIGWLKDYFDREEKDLKELLEKEIAKSGQENIDNYEPKWKIRFKLISPSHSIRANKLNKFNSKNSTIRFSKGADNHTLIVDIILDKKTPIGELWHHGWTFSKLLVASLNSGTNGLFYWNFPLDTEKYYEKIWDIENNKQLKANLLTKLQLDWKSKKMVLAEEELVLSLLVFRYFRGLLGHEDFEPVNDYMIALSMLAKNDIHLRLEPQCFLHFFLAFQKAIIRNEHCKSDFNIKEVGYGLIEQLITERTEFDKIMDLGIELQNNQDEISKSITLTEIIGIKQYSGLYFVTLAARKMYGDKAILLTRQK